jgi:hypothetical protein
MSTGFQEVFNLNKGSIPVRLNMSMDKFDDCAKLSPATTSSATAKTGGLVPSVAHGMAISAFLKARSRRGQPVLERRQDERGRRPETLGGSSQVIGAPDGTFVRIMDA